MTKYHMNMTINDKDASFDYYQAAEVEAWLQSHYDPDGPSAGMIEQLLADLRQEGP